ncbi:MAG: hypothetical protein C4527_19695 [Candidatus Omnitrophota bacterium]|nr:MAG: hypothetical protein C4527_19695 [Candidatus Omnitrophota bacterium]
MQINHDRLYQKPEKSETFFILSASGSIDGGFDIPVYRIGTKKLYKKSDLESWLETHASKRIDL